MEERGGGGGGEGGEGAGKGSCGRRTKALIPPEEAISLSTAATAGTV